MAGLVELEGVQVWQAFELVGHDRIPRRMKSTKLQFSKRKKFQRSVGIRNVEWDSSGRPWTHYEYLAYMSSRPKRRPKRLSH